MRIITGKARGLKLKTPSGFATRPTADRVKESLFNILGGMINFSEIKSVLDIFAGTGALGLESISRGATSATFIDDSTAEIIRENITRAKFDNCRVLRGDFEKILNRLSKENLSFDLIFCDPPYLKGFSQKSLNLIAENNLLSDDGLIIVEIGASEELDSIFKSIRRINYGKTTAIEIFEKTPELSEPERK